MGILFLYIYFFYLKYANIFEMTKFIDIIFNYFFLFILLLNCF